MKKKLSHKNIKIREKLGHLRVCWCAPGVSHITLVKSNYSTVGDMGTMEQAQCVQECVWKEWLVYVCSVCMRRDRIKKKKMHMYGKCSHLKCT